MEIDADMRKALLKNATAFARNQRFPLGVFFAAAFTVAAAILAATGLGPRFQSKFDLSTARFFVREAWGALCAGAAGGAAVVLVAFPKTRRLGRHYLPWLFVIVFFAVVGIGLLRSSADLAVSATAGLLLAFVISGVADCFLFAATKYPKAPRVFPVVFMTVLLLAGIVRIGSSLDSQDWYRSTARLKVRMTTTDSSTPGSAPAQHAVSRRQFFKDQCEVIRSEKLLRLAAADPELQRLWASMQDRPRSYSSRVSYNASDNQRRSLNSQQQPPKSDAFDSLKQRIAVRPIAGSSLIEIAVISPVAKEAAVIANVLATTYIRNKSEVTTPPQNSIVIEAEVLDRAVPATTALIYYKLSEIVWRLIIVLGLAFAAAGGAARIVSRMISKQRIRAPYWHIQSRFKHRN